MKRIISLTLVVLLVAALFVGCGSSSVDGTYKMTKINDMSLKDFYTQMAEAFGVSLDDLDIDLDAIADSFTLTLKADGTAVVKGDMEGESTEEKTGTWKQEGDKVTITIDDEPMEFTFKDGTLTAEMDGMAVTFSK